MEENRRFDEQYQVSRDQVGVMKQKPHLWVPKEYGL